MLVPIQVTLSGIVTDSSDVQYSNASEPILLTLFGMTTCVILLFEKACLPILVTVSGIYTVPDGILHLVNTPSSITNSDVNPSAFPAKSTRAGSDQLAQLPYGIVTPGIGCT